ncbi:MAG: hypothetical protein VX246_03695 [Myxococcota bacterium]|nr:hypothetical protein [Myxococcota bacterium]
MPTKRSVVAGAGGEGATGSPIANPRETVSSGERGVIDQAFGRLDPVALGAGVGVMSGVALALMTVVLLIRGGQHVGEHLTRLGYFLPGYTVSWPGVGVGFIDALVVGFGIGALLAALWNFYHRLFIAVVVSREHSRAMRRELQEL